MPSPDDDHSQGEVAEERTSQAPSRHATDPSAPTNTNRRRRPNVPLSEHFNEPVRQHVWHSKHRIWTRAQLDRERREFFETRVTGRPEMWAALSTAISLIQADDLATAQSIVDAAGITIPTGDLCEGCYDEQGVLYRLPQCIVSDPENMAESDTKSADEDADHDDDTEALSDAKLATDDASGDELITEDIERRRDEKGKTSERDLIRVRARLSDRGDPDLVLAMGKRQSVGFLARKIHQEATVRVLIPCLCFVSGSDRTTCLQLSSHQRVRIAYLGRMLKEQESLPDQGWQSGHVINALIVSPPIS